MTGLAHGHTEPAILPPDDLIGLDPEWSRLVAAPTVDGLERTWHLLDSGPADADLTMLCVHGNPTWSYLFRELVRHPPDGVRVVAVDQLDMGFSERTGRARRLSTRVDDLCRLTDRLGLDGRVVTVGHDWGGPISLGWALRHRAQLDGVVLMNTAVHQPAGAATPTVIRLTQRVLRTATVRTTAFIRGAFAISGHRPPVEVRDAFLAPYRTAERRSAIERFVADIPLDADHPSAAALDEIAAGLDDLADVPALLLWGAADRVFSDPYLHDLERRLPHADVHRFPTAGHLVTEDAPAIPALVDWIGQLVTAPAPTVRATEPSPLATPIAWQAGAPAVAEMGGDTIGTEAFELLVDHTARGLVAGGIEPGDRVGLMIPPGIDLAATLLACWRAGGVAVFIDAGLGPTGVNAAIRSAAPAHLVGIPKALVAARTLRWPGRRISTVALDRARRRLLGVVGDLPTLRNDTTPLPSPPTADDDAAIGFTSGATGPSKGVVYTHGRLVAQRDVIAGRYGITVDDRLVAAFAPFALYGPMLGITSVVPDMDVTAPASLTATALADSISRVDGTIVFASPAALVNVAATADELTDDQRRAMRHVRVVLSAGAPVRESILRATSSVFPCAEIATPYGMTECMPVADIRLADIDHRAADPAGTVSEGVCVGRPIHGVDVAIRPLDRLGHPGGELVTKPDVLGEIVVRAAHARAGYDRLWHTEFLASRPPGWHATGDVGQLDADGRLWVAGRTGHVITAPDGPLAPVRLEHATEGLADVRAAAAVGIGPAGRQQIVVVVEPYETVRHSSLADLDLLDRVRGAVREPIASVLVVPKLPVDRRHNSKIDRARLAAWAADVLAGGRLTTP